MLADYYIVRNAALVVDDLYDDRRGAAAHWYQGGFNCRALWSRSRCPSVITMIWFLPVSWLVGLPVGFVLYLLLNRERAT